MQFVVKYEGDALVPGQPQAGDDLAVGDVLTDLLAFERVAGIADDSVFSRTQFDILIDRKA